MQTFLPWPDFERSAQALDYRRLGKQRIEAWTIYLALSQPARGWARHPATEMWRGFSKALLKYGSVICAEWIERGYRDSMRQRFEAELAKMIEVKLKMPLWFGDEDFHRAHRSNLIRKASEYYRPQFGEEPDNLPYIWKSG